MTTTAVGENYNIDIIVEALDKQFKLEEFDLDKIDPLLFEWELGGITDPIGQLAAWIVDTLSSAITSLGADVWSWLTTIRDTIINSISSALTDVQNALSTAIDGVVNAVTTISTALSDLSTFIEGMFTSISTAISDLGVSIAGIVTAIETTVGGIITEIAALASTIQGFVSTVINQLSALGTAIYQNIASFSETILSAFTTAFTGLTEWLSGAINAITQGLTTLGTQLTTAIASIPAFFQEAFKGLTEWLSKAFTTVTGAITGFATTLTSFGQQIYSFLTELSSAIAQLGQNVVTGITQAWNNVQQFLTKKYEELVKGLGEVGTTLAGFINPLVEIKNWLVTTMGAIITPISEFFVKPTEKVAEFGTWLWQGLVTTGQTLWSYIGNFVSWIQQAFTRALAPFIDPLSTAVNTMIGSSLKLMSERIKTLPEGMGEMEYLSYVAMGYAPEVAKAMTPLAAAEAAGEAVGDQEVSLKPMGLGATIKFKLGAFLKTYGKRILKAFLDVIKYPFAAYSLWVVEPTKYWAFERLRNILPVQLPTPHELVEFTRRRMPTAVFDDWMKKSREIMQLRGFNDIFVDAMFTKAEDLPDVLKVTVRDRFGVERLLPTAGVYDLPTSSDFCRMMVRDIISLNGFKKAMLTRGMIPDIAKMYYLLHFRYPPLDKLFEFICRCSAGFAWVTKEPEKEEDLGVSGVAPSALNAISTELGRTFDIGTVKSKILDYTTKFLIPYAKWHDYAPFAYVEGFTADRLLNLDMMADIPMRIDGRWMYKWGIINEYDVFRIATARGMHPVWLESITIAECMNALAEERTLARTGVINVFKEGFTTEQLLKQSLSKLTTVKILGKEVDVKFLEGETKLLSLRAKYDRALDILRDYHKDLVRSFTENVIEWNDVTGALKKTTDALANGLGIKIAFDENYYKLYQPVAKSLQSVYTVRRIRYWLRYMMRSILSRFERGYISKKEVEEIVDEIVEFAKLTNEEKEAMIEVAEMLLSSFNREMIARGILRKLSRGIITTGQAKEKLKKMGLEDDVIDAMIEYHAKTYTLTLSQLISYMEYIPVPPELLTKKLDMLGVPPDEKKLVPAYAVARELSSEIGRLVTELITDYAKGLITEQQLRDELNNAATLWGKVRDLGVDWVILSPQEREILILLAKKRRERELAKKRT